MKGCSALLRIASLGCVAGLAGLLVSRAAAEPMADEQKALQRAQEAFNERAFDVANQRLAAFEVKYPLSNSRGLAQLLRLQALYEQGHSAEALAASILPNAQIPPELQAATAFWRGEALLDLSAGPSGNGLRAALAAPSSAI